jgi:predicted small integral membrane protein
MGLLTTACRAGVEGFVGLNSSEKRRDAYVDFVSFIIAFFIAIVILGFIGKWLWNAVVVDLFSFAKPARSFWQIIGLMFFLSLIHP